ncbi:MAG TPA: hypothetical protein VLB27_11270, partial [candidate division Zixibacteria bacterium]|nr:hypothetical protein [candidate division Zixibacteria bacterium]
MSADKPSPKSLEQSLQQDFPQVNLGEDLAAPRGRELASGRLWSAARSLSPTERRYQLRRGAVILLGLSVLAAPVFLIWLIVGLSESSGGSAGREFDTEITLRANVSADFNPLPGGRPILLVRALPELNAETGDWVEVLRTAVDDVDALQSVYAETVSPQVGFVIFDTLYAVTTNGGHTWSTLSVSFSGAQNTAVQIDGVILDEYGDGLL